MLSKKQEQKVSDNSTAIQSGRDINIVQASLTYKDVKEVALDIFRANFFELGKEAKEIARARAEEITEKYLSTLFCEHPSGLEKAHDPDFQYSLFKVQQEYARSGDKDMGDLLVGLLVDKTKQKQRDILQIVLNESINTVPKLTENQLAALSLIFLFRYSKNKHIGNHAELGLYFDKYAKPFIPAIVKNTACYQHLQYTGCGSIDIGERDLESWLGKSYKGLFMRGFDEKEISDRDISKDLFPLFFIRCLNDLTKLQVKAIDLDALQQYLETENVAPENRVKITELFTVGIMSDIEIREKCIEIRPYMSSLFNVWTDSVMKRFSLTSVGIAIGHANVKRYTGEFSDLSIWIN